MKKKNQLFLFFLYMNKIDSFRKNDPELKDWYKNRADKMGWARLICTAHLWTSLFR